MPVDPVIGCNVLAEPFCLPQSAWIPIPDGWARNIVQGKTYDSLNGDGAKLWAAVQAAVIRNVIGEQHVAAVDDGPAKYKAEYLTRGRLGGGAFRVLVTDAYQRRCAVTGEKTLPVLEAAHIKPFAQSGPHRVSNGILLRSDLHKLFDLGYLTVTFDLRLEVSPRLRTEWENGREYYAHHGQTLRVRPSDPSFRPGRVFLAWHNENRFRA